MSKYSNSLIFLLIVLTLTNLSTILLAADWSTTELHYQYGNLDSPGFAGGGDTPTTVLTFQHASGWKYGDNFFFIDFLDDSEIDGFNDSDYYGELYVNLSLSKILGGTVGIGPIKDIGLLAGLNLAGDANVRKYLPGIRLSWDVPGFAFLNTDFTAYVDDSSGVGSGGAPEENDSFMIDANWAYPLSIGAHDFSIEGHIEYIGQRQNEFGTEVRNWVLAQPQFRYDLGKTLFDTANVLHVGIEYQFWYHKLGDKDTNENRVQALVVWRL